MPKRRVIDAHVHLDAARGGSARDAVRRLVAGLDRAGIRRAVVLHLEIQPWPAAEVAAALRPHADRLKGFINVHPFARGAAAALRRGVSEQGFCGLKLHPRLQRYALEDKRTLSLIREAGALGVPVVIDAFPDGDWLAQGFDPLAFGRIARACSKTRIVAAHMGGHRVLDMMMLAKRIPNLYFDSSYALLYYRTSSVPGDMVYAMRSMRFSRVFYGSDYPDRPLDESLVASLAVLRRHGVTGADLDKILYRNAEEFFGWNAD